MPIALDQEINEYVHFMPMGIVFHVPNMPLFLMRFCNLKAGEHLDLAWQAGVQNQQDAAATYDRGRAGSQGRC
jgi:hypothetical protein